MEYEFHMMTAWTGRTEFEILKEDAEANLPAEGLPNASRPTGEENFESPSPSDVELEPQLGDRDDGHPGGDLRPNGDLRPGGEPDPEKVGHGVVRGHDDDGDNAMPEETGEPEAKRLRTRFLEVYTASVEKMLQAKMKKELSFNQIPAEKKQQFIEAIKKEIKNNLQTEAYEVLDPQLSEKVRRESGDKIVKSRFVLTEKIIEAEDVPSARRDGVLLKDQGNESSKAKAIHVMKGFNQTNAEDLETTTPQRARDTVYAPSS